MRPSFLLTYDNQLLPALIRQDDPHGLSIGMCLMLTRDFDTGYGLVPAGTKGWVEFIDEQEGDVHLRWEGAEPALFHWGNLLIMSPFNTPDLTAAMVVYDQRAELTGPTDPPQFKCPFASKRAKFALRVAACLLVVFVWELLLEPVALSGEGPVVDVMTYLEGFFVW